MSIFDHNRYQPAKHLGERLFEEFDSAQSRAQLHGQKVEAVIIGVEARRLIEAWLTEANGRPMTLRDTSICGRDDMPIVADSTNPMRVVALIAI